MLPMIGVTTQPEQIQPSKVYHLTSDAVMESFNDGALILNLQDLTLIELNPTARDILKMTDGHKSTNQIAFLLANECEITQDEALLDVIELLENLESQGIVEIAQTPD